jgi:hypothetical protein
VSLSFLKHLEVDLTLGLSGISQIVHLGDHIEAFFIQCYVLLQVHVLVE